jgi:beta-galactosidase
MPEPVRVFEIPTLSMQPFTSVWDNLPQPVSSDSPGTFEDHGQDYGFILYRTDLKDANGGKLIADVRDYATVFLDGQLIGVIDRCKGVNSIELPAGSEPSQVLEILVEAMGRISPTVNNADRKGIIGDVTLNGSVLSGWKIYNLPMDWKFIYGLRSTGKNLKKPGIFFKGNFSLIDKADTYFDVSRYTKGIIWINGHNLGRFWNNGPQTRLYCPASWIKTGMNEIIIFDLVQTEAKPFASFEKME